jgi:CRP-like cAMP-binding protein
VSTRSRSTTGSILLEGDWVAAPGAGAPGSTVRNDLLRGLPASEWNALKPHMSRVTLVSSQVLHEPGECVSDVFFIERGFASVMAVTAKNQDYVEVSLTGPEGMTGLPVLLGADAVMFNSVVIQMPGNGIRMPATALRASLALAPIFHQRLLRQLEAFIAQIAQTCACNSLHRTSERLARWLLCAFDRADDFEISLSQTFLATMLAATRPVVTTAMQAFAQQGLVRYGRSRVQVLDRPGLEAAACSCYKRVKTLTDAIARRPEPGNVHCHTVESLTCTQHSFPIGK